MKGALLPLVAVALTACSVLPAAPAADAATASPAVIIQTVLVTVAPPEIAAQQPTQPSAALPSPQVIVVTATPSTGLPTAQATAVGLGAEPTAPLPPDPGGGIFTNLTRSGDKLSLRCQPDTITFAVSTVNPYVTTVDLYYRIQDRLSTSISNWQFGGSLDSDKHGNFTMAFPSSRVDPDVRSHRAWLDYQFVAVNKLGDALGRSAKIAKQVTYTIDCTD